MKCIQHKFDRQSEIETLKEILAKTKDPEERNALLYAIDILQQLERAKLTRF